MRDRSGNLLTAGIAALTLLLGLAAGSLWLAPSRGGPERPEARRGEPPAGPSADPPAADDARAPESSPETAVGKWRPARTPSAAAEDWQRPEAAEAVMAMPYLQGYRPAGERRGRVRVLQPTSVQAGLNLYTSGHAPEAALMDQDGEILHRWGYPLERFRPELYEDGPVDRIRKVEYFRRARLLPSGELLAIYEGLGLIKLSPDSRLLWGYRGGAHHDLDVAPDGTIWVLDRRGRLLPRIDPDDGVLEDLVTILGPDGDVRRQISILEAFERSDYTALLERLPDQPDILHTNTLEILDGRLAARSPAFEAGNVLLSVLELDTVAVLDPDTETIVWALTGLWRKQHQPTVVGDDRILVFDNLGAGGGAGAVAGAGRERSRVLELNPFTQRITWRYQEDLYSKTLGSCQRLANGNTLITESENGRAVEVTPEGEVVWEFLTPHRVPADDGSGTELVAVLFEVERLPPDFPFPGGRQSTRGRSEAVGR